MKYQGINKDVSPTELQPGESPDAVNSTFFKGTYSALGPRPGKSSVNTTAFSNNTNGIFSYEVGQNRRWIYSDDNGVLTDYAPPYATWSGPSWSVYPQGVWAQQFLGSLDMTVTNLTAPLTVASAFQDGTVASWGDNSNYWAGSAAYYKVPDITFSLTASGTATNQATLLIYFGVRAGVTDYLYPAPSLQIVLGAGSPANQTYALSFTNDINNRPWIQGYWPDMSNSTHGIMMAEFGSVGAQVTACTATIRGCDRMMIF